MVCKSFIFYLFIFIFFIFFFSVYDIYMPFIFTFMAYSPPYFSVNGMMILVLAYKMASKVSQYIMAYRKIPFCLWHTDVGLHTFIFLFMT